MIASDGIWDALSLEEIEDCLAKYKFERGIENLCKKIVKKASKLWENLERNGRIDDITCILVFLNE